jgi:DNA-binding PadR family transcriptional regulator
MKRELSVASLTVLHAVASGTTHGFDVIEATELPAGTVYPALSRMERYYRITARGLTTLNDALARIHALKPIRRVRATSSR